MLRIKLLTLLVLTISGIVAAQPPINDPRVLRQTTFDKVWSTVNEKHYDPTFGGVDWQKVREKYEPLAMSASSVDQFHGVLRQMLAELKVSHFGIYSAQPQNERRSTGRSVGIDLIMIGRDVVVHRIAPDSPNLNSGIKPGMIIRAVDGVPVTTMLAPLEKSLPMRTGNQNIWQVYRQGFVGAMIDDGEDETVAVTVEGARSARRRIVLKRTQMSAEMSQALGNFPPQPIVFESRMLENNVGYIRFSMWVIPQLARVRTALREFANAKGIIFDLRGNPGGVGGIASGIAGNLVQKQISLGSMNGRDSQTKYIAYPQKDSFAGKIVVLTDYGSGSTSEIFAAGLQDNKRAVILGQPSAGAVLPSVFEILPTGAAFQYAVSDYRTPNNILVEGRGVTPDVIVPLTRASLLAGRDSQIDAAIKEIIK